MGLHIWGTRATRLGCWEYSQSRVSTERELGRMGIKDMLYCNVTILLLVLACLARLDLAGPGSTADEVHGVIDVLADVTVARGSQNPLIGQ